jgi:hypothetical protein
MIITNLDNSIKMCEVMDSVCQEFNSRFETTITDRIISGVCKDDNGRQFNMLICNFIIVTETYKSYVNQEYMDRQNNLFDFSKISNQDYKIENLRVEDKDGNTKTIFDVVCTF